MALLFIACGIFALIAQYGPSRTKPLFDKPLGALLGSIVAYGALSQIWTINPEDTLGKAGQLGMAFGLLTFLVPVIGSFSQDNLKRLGQLLTIGLGLGIATFLFEFWGGFKLYELTHPGNTDPVDNKQNKAAVLVMLWVLATAPYLMIKGTVKWRVIFTVLAMIAAYVTFASKSGTAQIIVMGLPFLALIVWLLPSRLTLPLAVASVLSITIAMPFAATYIYNNTEWETSTSLNGSLKSRIEIWNQASSRAFEKPILGWGLDGAPMLPNRGETSRLYTPPMLISHLHPHNAPIQIWFELGAIGIAAFCALFILLYRRTKVLTNDWAIKYATFAGSSVFLYTLSIWGIWQSWFICTLCFAGLMIYAGVRHIETAPKGAV
jgi:O-antigen ligase